MVQPPAWTPTTPAALPPDTEGPRADSVAKVVVLSIVTLGIYMLWWAGDRGHDARRALGVPSGLKTLSGWAIAVQALSIVLMIAFYIFFFLAFVGGMEDADCPPGAESCPVPDGFFQMVYTMFGLVALVMLVGLAGAILTYTLLVKSALAIQGWQVRHGPPPTLEPWLMLIGLVIGIWTYIHVGFLQNDINKLRGA